MSLRWLAIRPIAATDLRHDGNIFTVLRWVLASTVMFSHGWDLTQASRGLDPSVAILGFPVSRLAVWLFFTLSGFLVCGSLVKRGVGPFLLARALRLVPGLWAMLLVVPLVLWAAFGTLDAAAFARSGETHAFIWRNALLLGGAFTLPGLFDGHPAAGVVNGSLWTIPHEVRCYLALGLAGWVGLLFPRNRFTLVLLIGIAVHLALPADQIPALTEARRLSFSFFLGVLAWLWRDRLLLSWPLALALLVVVLATPVDFAWKMPIGQLCYGYVALVVAFRVPQSVKDFSARIPDYSYGIYIYAFPAQQAAIALGAVRPIENIALAFVLMLPFAALSWHLVEKPALALKPR